MPASCAERPSAAVRDVPSSVCRGGEPSDGEQPPDPAGDRPGPGRPQAAARCAAARARRRDARLHDRRGLAHRRSPRPQPRRRRDHPRAAPRLRLAARQDRLGHRAPGVRPQDPHRPAGRVRDAAPAGRAVGLPEPRRVRARRHREQPRLHRAVLRRRAGQGLPHPRRGPGRRGGRRRRRAHRRDVLGGAQQHRRRRPADRHRRQRQRPLLRPHRRRARRPPRHAAHDAGLRAGPRDGAHHAGAHAGRRGAALHRAARRQARGQGLPAAAGAVRGPRPEVRRADRRPRHSRARGGAAAGQGVRRAGHRARDHGQGLRLPAGRRRRGRLPAQRRHHRPGHRQGDGHQGGRLHLRVRRGDRAVGDERPDVVAITAAMLQPVGLQAFARPTPSARSTSASPSSTP